MSKYVCQKCGRSFDNPCSIGPHVRFCKGTSAPVVQGNPAPDSATTLLEQIIAKIEQGIAAETRKVEALKSALAVFKGEPVAYRPVKEVAKETGVSRATVSRRKDKGPTPEVDGTFTCRICGQGGFVSPQAAGAHRRHAHPDKSEKGPRETVESPAPAGTKLFDHGTRKPKRIIVVGFTGDRDKLKAEIAKLPQPKNPVGVVFTLGGEPLREAFEECTHAILMRYAPAEWYALAKDEVGKPNMIVVDDSEEILTVLRRLTGNAE